jgi:hypothetical protein
MYHSKIANYCNYTAGVFFQWQAAFPKRSQNVPKVFQWKFGFGTFRKKRTLTRQSVAPTTGVGVRKNCRISKKKGSFV